MKTQITQETVDKIFKRERNGLIFGIVFFLVCAVLVMILIPQKVLGIVIDAAIVVIVVLMIIFGRPKGKASDVYFVKRPIKEMYSKKEKITNSDHEEEEITTYHLIFEKTDHKISKKMFDNSKEGEMFYLLYRKTDNAILEIYKASEYELDPSLELRE